MNRFKNLFLATLAIGALAAPAAAQVAPAVGDLVINEVSYDDAGTDAESFIELYNVSGNLLDMTTVDLVGWNNGAAEYNRQTLTGTLAANGYYLIFSNSNSGDLVATPDHTWSGNPQNGGNDGLFIELNGSATILDSVMYEGSGHPATAPDMGEAPGQDGASDGTSLSRRPDGADTDDNAVDFAVVAFTPGAANPAPPAGATMLDAYAFNNELVATFDVDPGAVVAGDFTFLEGGLLPVGVTGVSGTGTTRTLTLMTNPGSDANQDSLAVAVTAGTLGNTVMFYSYPPISLIQDGTIAVDTIVGIRATVTAIPDASGALSSTYDFAVATASGANNGIFVDDDGVNAPAIGDEVEVFGAVNELNDLSRVRLTDPMTGGYQNNGVSGTTITATVVADTDFQFNNPTNTAPAEQWEGVLISIGPLTNAFYDLDPMVSFGEIDFAEGVNADDVFIDIQSLISNGGGTTLMTGIGLFSFGEYKLAPFEAASVPVELSAFSLE